MTSHILSSVEVEGKISSGKDDEQGTGNLHCMQHNSLVDCARGTVNC